MRDSLTHYQELGVVSGSNRQDSISYHPVIFAKLKFESESL